MRASQWDSTSPSSDTSRGVGDDSLSWFSCASRCQRCTKLVTHQQGVICANFGKRVSILPLCQNAWCSECYKTPTGIDFLIYRPLDVDGEELIAPADGNDYLQARGGDHLFCPFECDNCCFFQLKGATPVVDNQLDDLLLKYIRRVNLDAFWSRRPGTVRGLVRMFNEQKETGDFFGFQMFKPLGPFAANYQSGIGAAIGLLRKSQRAGRHEDTIKYSSVRKARSVHTNVYQASAVAAAEAIVFRSEKTRMVATSAPTDSAWFMAFMTGYRARVGERRKHDAAISIQVMLKMQEFLEQDLEALRGQGDDRARRHLIEHGAFFLFLYCGSLRGFEGSKIELNSLRNQMVALGSLMAREHEPHVFLVLAGKFKSRGQSNQKIQIPIAYETASGLAPGKWGERLVRSLERVGIQTGWAFQKENGHPMQMENFEEKFYELLHRVKMRHPELMTEEVEINDDFHIT
jgi:hypothetical protein